MLHKALLRNRSRTKETGRCSKPQRLAHLAQLLLLCTFILWAPVQTGLAQDDEATGPGDIDLPIGQVPSMNNQMTLIPGGAGPNLTKSNQAPEEDNAEGSSSQRKPLFSLSINDTDNPDDLVPALRVVALITLLTFAPAILLLMSSFTRILIVLSFLRQAIGAPTMPPNQVLIGLSLFMTYFVMAPTVEVIYDQAVAPYMDKQISADEAASRASEPIKNFMLRQTRPDDLKLFYKLGQLEQPASRSDVSMRALIPAFVISELKAAFQIGFLVYLPFIVIDMIVSSVLMAMGMMMLPPTIVSLPLKIVLFVLVDGWNLLTGSLISSFI
jgi:flagellar biosynthetic protein FliP